MTSHDDEQTLHYLRYYTRELLKDAGVLPEGLAAMLRDYEPELYSPPWRRWEGIGEVGQSESLAAGIGQRLTDGEWLAGTRLDAGPGHWYLRGHTQASRERALRLLAARGELALRDGAYYTGDPGDGA